MTRAGFIGLGSQGAPMARRIVDAGVPLTIWARRSATTEPFADTGAQVAATPAELGAASDVVGICVVSDADVEDVVLRDDGVLAGMAPGGVLAIHATIHPDTCRRIAQRAAAVGVAVVDAPVSGGAPAASAGTLLVMVGGDADDLERCRPVFATYGDPILHLGPLGSGEVAKVLNNFVFTAQVAAGLETYRFARELGIDEGALAQVLARGSGGSFAGQVVGGSHGDLSGLAATAGALLRKDVDIVRDLARAMGADAPRRLDALADDALGALGA